MRIWPLALLLALPAAASPSRLKDVAVLSGMGKHKLLGYGLVVGLDNTGDSDSSSLTARGIANMLESFGVTVTREDFKAKNVAAVIVTGDLPPVIVVGGVFDVTVSSLADAKSLQGGMLLLTPLKAADGEVYAIAQGPLTVGGFMVQTRGGDQAQKNHVTVGRVPNGASAVKALAPETGERSELTFCLLQPDFTTAWRLAKAVNEGLGQDLATATDQATVRVTIPDAARGNLTPFMAALENLPVEPDATARVVINERTGTVVIGSRVRLLPVAISHGGLTVEVRAETQVSQPPPLVGQVSVGGAAATATVAPPPAPEAKTVVPKVIAPPVRPGSLTGGKTVTTRQEDLTVTEEEGSLAAIPEQATLDDLVKALNTLGVKPRDLIAILQALKESGALQAELVLL